MWARPCGELLRCEHGLSQRSFVFSAVLLHGCGASSKPVPFRVESAYDTAVIQERNNACVTSYAVHRDGSAQKTSQNCQGDNGAKAITLGAQVAAQLFGDLQAAQPLSALPPCIGVDTSTSIAWNGQQTPGIGACPGSTSSELALLGDVSSVTVRFEPVP